MASPQVENGFTRIANELLEELLKYKFPKNTSIAPLSICLFVMRKTYGYRKIKDRISLSQFELGLNISRPTIVHWLEYLVKAKLLVKAIKPLGSEYSFNKDYHQWIPLVKAIELVKARKFASKSPLTDIGKVALTHKRKKKLTKEILQSKDCEIFSSKEYIKSLIGNKRRDTHIIGLFFKHKETEFDNKEQANSQLKRHLRPARDLKGYSDEQILATFEGVDKESKCDKEYIWTLETILKRIQYYK